MQTWQCIQQSIDYIDKHYDEELNIDKLAKIANLSTFYYQRVFKRLVKKTVNEYIKLRRLAYSINLLKKTTKSILEIALDCGFNSASTFTKSFKEIYNITPSYYRKEKITLDYFIKPNLSLNYTNIDLGVPLIVENMVLEINEVYLTSNKLFIGESKLSLISEISQPKINDLLDIWNNLQKDSFLIAQKTTIHNFLDVLTPSNKEGYFNYFAGAEVDTYIDGYEKWTMPSGKYLVCYYEADTFEKLVSEALYQASGYFYDTWLPAHKIETEPFIVQKYSNPNNDIHYIELWAKVKTDV